MTKDFRIASNNLVEGFEYYFKPSRCADCYANHLPDTNPLLSPPTLLCWSRPNLASIVPKSRVRKEQDSRIPEALKVKVDLPTIGVLITPVSTKLCLRDSGRYGLRFGLPSPQF